MTFECSAFGAPSFPKSGSQIPPNLVLGDADHMKKLNVRLISGVREWELGDLPRIVPAGQIVLAVRGNGSSTILLDGHRTRLTSGLVGIDLTRSTGYHRLDIEGRTFWFGTQDAKLQLDGIEAMLNELGNQGTGWGGQVLFSDGAGLRNPHVVYGWLDEWAESTLTAVESVLASPRPRTTRSEVLSRRGGSGVLRAPTLRLLRSAPKQYLSPDPNGALQMSDGSRYTPLRVVVRKRSTSLDTIANRRAVALLTWLIRLNEEVLENKPSNTARVRCRLWLNRAQTLARRPLAQALRSVGPGIEQSRQAEETTDAPYRMCYAATTDLRRLFAWSATSKPLGRYSYVDRSDEIYQAYAASRLAKELGMQQTHPVLGSERLAFTGERFDMYYDTTSPPSVLRSWRAQSLRPDDSRPDLLIHEKATGRVAVLDAKYRVARDGGASEDSRKEVTAYLGLYGISSISILFPGDGDAVTVSGHGRSIHEIPLRPGSDLSAAVPLILGSFSLPPF
ncbi:hypothetical protein RER_00470 [Rhodococcus erythropolis PR4]|uniref:McrBC 5-methylcytosine restriction system component n=1 Tax=Rhodococcus erythropolis (strain PR4 / NBRC 100887) TaxID=234621 RepID=C0ZLI7_RHOE4|nr:hypothetical protein RER_00470 [Rhodococcus erythropolis PR4]